MVPPHPTLRYHLTNTATKPFKSFTIMNSTPTPIVDPLVLSFWTFNTALILSLIGSIIRRVCEMNIVKKHPEVTERILKGESPLMAKIAMYIFKVPSYAFCGITIWIACNHRESLFFLYSLATILLLWIPFETKPKEEGAPSINLQSLSERLKWTYWISTLAPFMALVMDTLLNQKLSMLPWLLTLTVLALEFLFFKPKEKRFWLSLGIDFEAGTDKTSERAYRSQS